MRSGALMSSQNTLDVIICRTLDVITEHTIESAGIWYVDDLNACSNRRTYVKDMSRVDDEVRTLLDPESMAAEKDKSGRQLDMIGWLIDLDAQLVTISDRNFNKTPSPFIRSRSWLRWLHGIHRSMC